MQYLIRQSFEGYCCESEYILILFLIFKFWVSAMQCNVECRLPEEDVILKDPPLHFKFIFLLIVTSPNPDRLECILYAFSSELYRLQSISTDSDLKGSGATLPSTSENAYTLI